MPTLLHKTYTFKTFEAPNGEQVPIDAKVTYGEDGLSTRAIAVWYHGGGFCTGNNNMIPRYQLELLHQNGFVVVGPNYRLVPTISVKNGPAADSIDAYRWARNLLPEIFKGGLPNPPRAIVDFFGMKYFRDPFWSQPFPALSKLPDLDETFINRIFDEVPPPTATPPPFGPAGPDLSKPRNAFMFAHNKKGDYIKAIVQDDDYDAIDPAPLLSKPDFPPVYIVQGTADTVAPHQHNVQAEADLKKAGNEVQLHLVEGAPHGFDMKLQLGDAAYEVVKGAFEFLRDHAQ